MKIINKLFVSHRFPAFWCIILSYHIAITIMAGWDNVPFPFFNLISIISFGNWIEDLEAGRHKPQKKTIITILIVITCLCLFIGFINSNDTRKAVILGYFIISLVFNVLYLLASIWERILHNEKEF